jgi:hypothetical protein
MSDIKSGEVEPTKPNAIKSIVWNGFMLTAGGFIGIFFDELQSNDFIFKNALSGFTFNNLISFAIIFFVAGGIMGYFHWLLTTRKRHKT